MAGTDNPAALRKSSAFYEKDIRLVKPTPDLLSAGKKKAQPVMGCAESTPKEEGGGDTGGDARSFTQTKLHLVESSISKLLVRCNSFVRGTKA
jgi:hypothetical protein